MNPRSFRRYKPTGAACEQSCWKTPCGLNWVNWEWLWSLALASREQKGVKSLSFVFNMCWWRWLKAVVGGRLADLLFRICYSFRIFSSWPTQVAMKGSVTLCPEEVLFPLSQNHLWSSSGPSKIQTQGLTLGYTLQSLGLFLKTWTWKAKVVPWVSLVPVCVMWSPAETAGCRGGVHSHVTESVPRALLLV